MLLLRRSVQGKFYGMSSTGTHKPKLIDLTLSWPTHVYEFLYDFIMYILSLSATENRILTFEGKVIPLKALKTLSAPPLTCGNLVPFSSLYSPQDLWQLLFLANPTAPLAGRH